MILFRATVSPSGVKHVLLLGEDKEYLKKLYDVLQRNDNWFWENRKAATAVLRYGACDTGEDYSQNFRRSTSGLQKHRLPVNIISRDPWT